MVPSALCLILNTHLQLIILRFVDGGTKYHVLFPVRAENSDSMATFQLGSDNAMVRSEGSSQIDKLPYRIVPSEYILGFLIPDCDRVHGAWSGTIAEAEACAVAGAPPDCDRVHGAWSGTIAEAEACAVAGAPRGGTGKGSTESSMGAVEEAPRGGAGF
jgi:hypothetical protein